MRGIENLVVGHLYQQMYKSLPLGRVGRPGPSYRPNYYPVHLLAVGFIGRNDRDGLIMGRLDLSMGLVHEPRNARDLVSLVYQDPYRPHPTIWYASDAGVELYPSGYSKVNFLVDLTDMGQHGLRFSS